MPRGPPSSVFNISVVKHLRCVFSSSPHTHSSHVMLLCCSGGFKTPSSVHAQSSQPAFSLVGVTVGKYSFTVVVIKILLVPDINMCDQITSGQITHIVTRSLKPVAEVISDAFDHHISFVVSMVICPRSH